MLVNLTREEIDVLLSGTYALDEAMRKVHDATPIGLSAVFIAAEGYKAVNASGREKLMKVLREEP